MTFFSKITLVSIVAMLQFHVGQAQTSVDSATFNGHEYELFTEASYPGASTFAASQTRCGVKGHLVTIGSQEENTFVHNLFKDYPQIGRWGVWLGLDDVETENDFKWVTGEAHNYENWAAGEPNDYVHVGGEDHACMVKSSGEWNDLNGNEGTSFTNYFVVEYDCPKQGSSDGDPHFKTWSGEKFDFHGGCDLVLLQDPTFAGGLGLNVHIRTKISAFWSYIESAVVQIGDQMIEVAGSPVGEGPVYWVNGLPGNTAVEKDENLKTLQHELVASIKGFKVNYHQLSAKQHRFHIDLGKHDALSLQTFKDFVAVNVKAVNQQNFESAKGMMGAYPSGQMLARDGVTVIEDPNEFGKEWQVLAEETMLFHTDEGTVQAPKECAMPVDVAEKRKRRLGEGGITMEEAEVACSRVRGEDRDGCIFDVLATQDKEMAGSY